MVTKKQIEASLRKQKEIRKKGFKGLFFDRELLTFKTKGQARKRLKRVPKVVTSGQETKIFRVRRTKGKKKGEEIFTIAIRDKKNTLYRDSEGNFLTQEDGNQFAVRNKMGSIIRKSDAKKFARRPAVKKALKKRLGSNVVVTFE